MDSPPLYTVLIVDDDPVTRLLMKQSLQDPNLTIIEAQNGEQAIDLFAEHLPDITLLDVSMPGMDGFTCCRKLRSLPKGQQSAIVMVTIHDKVDEIEKAFEAGATDFITKPFKWPLFSHRIHYILNANNTLRELSQSRSKLAKAQAIAHLVYWEWDFKQNRIDCSGDLYRLLGIENTSQGVSFKHIIRHIFPEDRALFKQVLRRAINQKHSYDIEYRVQSESGQLFYLHERTEIIEDYDGWKIIGTLQDITLLKQSEQEIAYFTYYDTLTDLPNRRLFLEQLETAIARARHKQQSLTLMFIDLDHFKHINDKFGHLVGDVLLCEAAARIKDCLRDADLIAVSKDKDDRVARFAGDEFTVMLTNIDNVDVLANIAQRIVAKFEKSFDIKGYNVFSTVSIGIALFPEDGDNVQSLMQHADVAMNHAKELGRNNYQFFSTEMNDYLYERLQIEQDLRQALERNEFLLFYQPQIEVETNKIIGFEALLRWLHPTKGLLGPLTFIDVAESTGLIITIGEWVLNQACLQTHKWQQRFGGQWRVSVNLSAMQFNQQLLLEQVGHCLNASRLPASSLELEITETAMLTDVMETIPLLNALKEMGVGLAIDDFGTGYSSLSYLKNFPINTLKIDKTFVDEIVGNPKDAAIARTIVQLADNLGLRTIAEGVESVEQVNMLTTMGCKELQGYYYSKPLPASEIERLLVNAYGMQNH
ncbi:two-component system response regulator [Methylophaga nitratireducenticrescens]|uniref:cyclic-guanylate-specific phosphodiesterase n=1 Tax=Methylophaga nitratireducenticrescens TaxID=754476 RepID=I1XIT1_METNJ|nr:EAL domain-containing protein [Methylophaga nitratireducenticrescens]AFI84300.1 two-component system response regulator [Methylophaga nitratireducenticrescens]